MLHVGWAITIDDLVVVSSHLNRVCMCECAETLNIHSQMSVRVFITDEACMRVRVRACVCVSS